MTYKNSKTLAPSGISGIHDAAAVEAVASQLPGRENGPADAYRHLLGAAELTRQYKENKAEFMLDANELISFESKEVKEMDNHKPQPPRRDRLDRRLCSESPAGNK